MRTCWLKETECFGERNAVPWMDMSMCRAIVGGQNEPDIEGVILLEGPTS